MPRSPRSKARAPSGKAHGPSKIAEGVYVGGWKDAVKFEGTRICVLDELSKGDAGLCDLHVPIFSDSEGRALRPNLDRVAHAAQSARAHGRAVLLFCGHGVRRGPLAGAWYLHVAEKIPLEAAFDRVESARRGIERPHEWIPDPSSLDDDGPA